MSVFRSVFRVSMSASTPDLRIEGDSLAAQHLGSTLLAALPNITNTAVGGSTLAGVLSRMQDSANSALLPRIHIFWDGASNEEAVAADLVTDYQGIVAELPHTRFIIVPPINPYDNTYAGSLIEEKADALEAAFPDNFMHWDTVLPVQQPLNKSENQGVAVGYNNTINSQTDDSFVSTKGTTPLRVYVNLPTVSGMEYRLQATISGASALATFVRSGSDGTGTVITSTSSTEIDLTFTATGAETNILFVDTTSPELTVTGISITPPANSIDIDSFQDAPSDVYHITVEATQLVANALAARVLSL